MTQSYKWTITPTGITGADGARVINRLLYNLTATDGEAKGDLGAPGIVYLSKPVPADGVTPATLAGLLCDYLGPENIAVYKRIAEKNLAAFREETVTVGG
jgi:hypothetical protein